MTEKVAASLERLREYYKDFDKKIYAEVMDIARDDRRFRLLVQDMTINEALGKSQLARNRHKFN